VTQARKWFRYSALNLVEHGVTRGADVLMTFAVVWGFSAESFSLLATAQAMVAPLLLFFPPVYILYKEFAGWKAKSPDTLAGYLWILRRFGLGLGQLAFVLALIAAIYMPVGTHYWTRFWALLWGFSLTAGINVFAPDRELLRIELKMRDLNTVTFFQKATALAGTLTVVFFFPGRIELLALVMLGSVVATARLSYIFAARALREAGASEDSIRGKNAPPIIPALKGMMSDFSLWNHLSGVIWNWIQSLDLFFLGFFKLPVLTLGLYSVGLKIANLSLAVPMAFGNIFAVWVGRRLGDEKEHGEEKGKLLRFSGILFAGCVLQGAALYLVAPYLISLLAHGRWDDSQRATLLHWLGWIIAGSSVFGSAFLLNWWLTLRASASSLLARVYCPLLVLSLGTYGFTAKLKGPDGTAPANLAVAGAYLVLLLFFVIRTSQSGNEPAARSPSTR